MDARFQYDGIDRFAAAINVKFSGFSGRIGARFIEIAPTATQIAVTSIRAVTPQNPQPDSYRSGKLAASTEATDLFAGPEFLTFNIRQPATSEPNMDGSGGGAHYVQWVLPPGRRAIEAPSTGPYSTGKKVLWGPHFGPAKRVRAYAGSPYPLEANDPIKTGYTSLLNRWGEEIAMELVA